ncbi:MAG: SDR family oxidoreductase [Candidatus Lokiarchaeota archaeon]|nr:SDR family oxidoreductase [Candidatus Lokiarchaeota archaeon]
MKVLFIGGTGNISISCSRLALKKGIDLYLLNRGTRQVHLEGAKFITGDIKDRESIEKILDEYNFDVVVNWIAFNVNDVEFDYKIFNNKIKQYIFISSASVYQKPPIFPIITESTPLKNPYWQYSRDKIACEDYLMQKYRETNFPITIVRPSLTYNTVFPIAAPGWDSYTIIHRMLKGKKIPVQGDGTSLWTVTHSDDFAKGFNGLLGNIQTIGHSFHITSDEILTWNQIYEIIANAVGAKANLIHIPSDFIAKVDKDTGDSLLGDKTYSAIFDNSKIKKFVPDFVATIPFSEGIKKILDWFNEDEKRKAIDDEINKTYDKIIDAYENKF